MENAIAPILEKYSTCPIAKVQHPAPDGIRFTPFNSFEICNEDERKFLSKLVLQTLLLQRNNANAPNPDVENNLQKFFSSDVDLFANTSLYIVEIHPLMKSAPLILIDGMLFVFLPPKILQDTGSSEHRCFMFPISATRFLLWGNHSDLNYFASKYQNIHFLNLCRIEAHEKKCRIATQDKEYLDCLIPRIECFSAGNNAINIAFCRDWE